MTDAPDLTPTGGQTVGPFYSFGLEYDGDNQLVPPGSAGAVRLHGHVYDGAGEPVPDALLEIRQADASGHVPTVAGSLHRDGFTFTGWGRCGTDLSGHYVFSTIEPAPVGDAPAAYFAVTVFARGLLNRLFTRIYLPDGAFERDPLLREVEEGRRETMVAERDGEASLRFDVHLQGPDETVFIGYPRLEG